MSDLSFPPGESALRLTALTPANCGGTGGSAAVDMPLALDSWSGLPYLPSAALKGVMAGRRGNVINPTGSLNAERVDLFGAPDDDGGPQGKPGDLVFGDGELLAFPLVLNDGTRVAVAVAATVYRLARRGRISGVDLEKVDIDNAFEGPIAAQDLPSLAGTIVRGRFGDWRAAVEELLGLGAMPVILAAPRAATWLWRAAAEERSLTALEYGRVRPGSLRQVELVPAGSVFVSLVHYFGDDKAMVGRAAPLQLGAGEAAGLGYFVASVIGNVKGRPTRPGAAPRGQAGGAKAHETMLRIFGEMKNSLKGRAEEAKARSAIYDLGPKLRIRGLESTLAFCLAKARLGDSGSDDHDEDDGKKAKLERQAYRWLLACLFPGSGEQLYQRVVDTIAGSASPPPEFHDSVLWLRRYAETVLEGKGQ